MFLFMFDSVLKFRIITMRRKEKLGEVGLAIFIFLETTIKLAQFAHEPNSQVSPFNYTCTG